LADEPQQVCAAPVAADKRTHAATVHPDRAESVDFQAGRVPDCSRAQQPSVEADAGADVAAAGSRSSDAAVTAAAELHSSSTTQQGADGEDSDEEVLVLSSWQHAPVAGAAASHAEHTSRAPAAAARLPTQEGVAVAASATNKLNAPISQAAQHDSATAVAGDSDSDGEVLILEHGTRCKPMHTGTVSDAVMPTPTEQRAAAPTCQLPAQSALADLGWPAQPVLPTATCGVSHQANALQQRALGGAPFVSHTPPQQPHQALCQPQPGIAAKTMTTSAISLASPPPPQDDPARSALGPCNAAQPLPDASATACIIVPAARSRQARQRVT
jgi:hypothetical protein